MIRRAVAAEELRPVGGPRRLPAAEVGEGDARAELASPRVAREHRAGLGIDLGDDERRRGAPRHAEHPLDAGGHRQPSRPSGRVRQRETRDLDRIVERHQLQELERDAVRDVLEARVALPVPDDVRRGLLADRQRRRPPQLARLLVPDVDRLPRRVADRIVGPGRELVLAAVDRPRVPGPALGDLEAEARIRDHVDPRRRRPLPRRASTITYSRPSCAKPPRPLKSSRSSAGLGRLGRRPSPASAAAAGTERGLGPLRAGQLLGQGAAPARQHHARHRLEHVALRRRHAVRAHDVHVAGRAGPFVGARRLARAHQRLQRRLEVLDVGRRALVQDHQIDRELLHAASTRGRGGAAARSRRPRARRSGPARSAGRPRSRAPTARRDRPAGAPARPPGAAATGPSRGRDWPGSGRDAPRRARCRGGAAGPGPASRPASPRGRTWPGRDTSPRGRGPPRATARRASRTRPAPSRPAGTRTRRRRLTIGSSTAPMVPDSAPAVDHRPPVSGSRARGRGTGRDRSPTAGRRPSRPRPPTTWASQTGASPRDRGRRVASSVSSSGTYSVCTLRLENAGWASVRRRRRQHDLGVRRQLDLPRPRPEVRERDAPDLGVVLRRHDHLERGADGPVPPDDLRPVLGKRDRVAVRRAAPRLVAGRPGLAAVDVAKEHVGPPRVARDVLPPARDGEIAPAAVARARRRQHHRVASVREQLGPRHRAVRRGEAPLDRRHELAHVADGLHLVRARPGDRHVTRRPLLQEQLGGLDHRLGVEARAHRAVVQGVRDRHDQHALVVRHVGAHHRELGAFGQPGRGVVERLVEAVASAGPGRRQAPEVADGGRRIDHRRQSRRIRRDDDVLAEPASQPEARDAEVRVLVGHLEIPHVVARLRHAPRHAALGAVRDLPLARRAARSAPAGCRPAPA